MKSLGQCKSCGNQLVGKYCHQCGEKLLTESDRSIRVWISDLISNLSMLDGKVLTF